MSAKNTGLVVLLLLALLGGLVSVPAGRASAQTAHTVSISPASVTVGAGESFTVDLNIVTADMTGAIQFEMFFDPDLLQCDRVETSSSFVYETWAAENGASVQYLPVDPSNTIDNSAGTLGVCGIGIVGASVVNFEKQGMEGSGTFARLHFTAKTGVEGTSTLSFTQLIVFNAEGGDPTSPDDYGVDPMDPPVINEGTITVGAGGSSGNSGDLYVSKLEAQWIEEGSTYNIVYSVSNNATGTAAASYTGIYIDGELVSSEACDDLEDDDSDERTVGPFLLSGYTDEIEIVADDNDEVGESDETNNSLILIWGVDLVPDLTVLGQHEEWIVIGSTYNVVYVIENQGTDNAETSTTGIYIDGNLAGSDACALLEPGDSETYTAGPFTLSGDSDEIEVRADSGGVVAESDETNNTVINVWNSQRPVSTTAPTSDSQAAAQGGNVSQNSPAASNGVGALSSSVSADDASGAAALPSDPMPEYQPPSAFTPSGLTIPWEVVFALSGAVLISVVAFCVLRFTARE